jgi:hypothetical protein
MLFDFARKLFPSRGTLSLLVGAHQVVVHPLCVLVAWWRLYGTMPTWWECVCILVHDWGYWGCASMDGEDGKLHPEAGAEIAAAIVDWVSRFWWRRQYPTAGSGKAHIPGDVIARTYALCHGHSRYYARSIGRRVPLSRLYAADKLGAALHPIWLYLPGAWLSGELEEYRRETDVHYRAGREGVPYAAGSVAWFRWMRAYMRTVAHTPDDACLRAGHCKEKP